MTTTPTESSTTSALTPPADTTTSNASSSDSDSLQKFPIQSLKEVVFQRQTYEQPWQRIKSTCIQQPWVPIGFGSSLFVLSRGMNAIRKGDSKTGQKMLRISVLLQFGTLGCALLGKHFLGQPSKQSTTTETTA